MRSRVRLRVLVPLAAAVVVAAAGLAVLQLDLLDKVGLTSSDTEPAAAAPAVPEPSIAAAGSASEEAPGETTMPGETGEATPTAPASASGSGGMDALEEELATHDVVVLVAYMPDSAVDLEVTREARLAAADTKAGFVSVNAAREKMIRELATVYDIRDTPTVLVFTPGPQLDNRLIGYVDQTTVAQAAVQALALSD